MVADSDWDAYVLIGGSDFPYTFQRQIGGKLNVGFVGEAGFEAEQWIDSCFSAYFVEQINGRSADIHMRITFNDFKQPLLHIRVRSGAENIDVEDTHI